jgi:hypothetical protein
LGFHPNVYLCIFVDQYWISFVLSFATLSELINDEKSRTFLTIEIGAGHHEVNVQLLGFVHRPHPCTQLRSLSDALTPALQAIRQQGYYANPRFHASFAWALLHQPRGPPELEPATSDSICTDPVASAELQSPSLDLITRAPEADSFPTIECLPREAVKSLNEHYGKQLSAPKVGTFSVDSITLKIGKDVSSWMLIGI